MKLKNPFSLETKLLFIDHQFCMVCLSNNMPELHHIAGRISDSPLNAIVLCHECHSKCGHSENEEVRFFKITLKHLMRIMYTITCYDYEFIKKYPRLEKAICD